MTLSVERLAETKRIIEESFRSRTMVSSTRIHELLDDAIENASSEDKKASLRAIKLLIAPVTAVTPVVAQIYLDVYLARCGE